VDETGALDTFTAALLGSMHDRLIPQAVESGRADHLPHRHH
jgi:hypothetical protein